MTEKALQLKIKEGEDDELVKLSDENRLSIHYPDLTKEWHLKKNGELRPENVSIGSNKKVWWQCKKESKHEWEAMIKSRKNGIGCPYCSGLLVTAEESLKSTHPHIAKEWHPEKNGDLTPDQVRYASHKKVWWSCSEGHEYPTIISHRTVSGTGCPYCSNHFVCTDNCLATVRPDLAKEWHSTKNNGLTPYDVTSGSEMKIWWKCEKNHEYEEKLKNRNRGVSCPHCLMERSLQDNSMVTLFPDLIKEWHPTKNNELKPEDVTYGTNKKVWWQCEKGHEFHSRIVSRTKNRIGCPYCSGSKATEGNNLGVLFPELIEEWHPTKNDVTPFQVLSKSDKVMWWKCKEGHEYPMSIKKKTKGFQCPKLKH